MGFFAKKKDVTPTSSQPETPRSIADTTTSADTTTTNPLNTVLAQSEPNTTPRSMMSDVSGAPTHTSVPESVVVTKQIMPAIKSGKTSNPGSNPNSRPNSGKNIVSKSVSKPVSKTGSNPNSKPNSRVNSGKNGVAPISKPVSKPASAKKSATKQKANSVMVHPTVHDISPNLPKSNTKSPTRKTMPAEHKLSPIVKIKSKQIRKKSATKVNEKSKVGNPGAHTGHRSSSTIYIPPSKLLKHLDPDEKSKAKEKNAKNSVKKQVLSTQVNRLLKQNTQDLFASLTHEVKKAFETLFDRIDVTDSGGITAKEIQQLIKKHTNKNLTLQQVQNVLRDLDVKGTGDIEFDEFIFMLSQPSNYVRLLDKSDLKAISTKETQKFLEMNQKPDENDTTYVFFEALRNATKQDSMTALRTFYKNRLKKLNDHVIHDWSAGQRCIGLSDQEMLKRYETIQGELLRQRVNFCKDNSYKTSPYARPLEWGVMNLREAIIARRKLACEIKPPKPELRRADLRAPLKKSVPLPRYVTKARSPLKRTFDYDQLSDIRTKVDNIARNYYNEARNMADENSKVVQKELAVEEIRSPKSRTGFMHTFEAYCTPFVVSPWIPMPSPTLLTSYSPLGRSKFGALRARNTVIHGRRGYTTGDCSKYKYMGIK